MHAAGRRSRSPEGKDQGDRREEGAQGGGPAGREGARGGNPGDRRDGSPQRRLRGLQGRWRAPGPRPPAGPQHHISVLLERQARDTVKGTVTPGQVLGEETPGWGGQDSSSPLQRPAPRKAVASAGCRAEAGGSRGQLRGRDAAAAPPCVTTTKGKFFGLGGYGLLSSNEEVGRGSSQGDGGRGSPGRRQVGARPRPSPGPQAWWPQRRRAAEAGAPGKAFGSRCIRPGPVARRGGVQHPASLLPTAYTSESGRFFPHIPATACPLQAAGAGGRSAEADRPSSPTGPTGPEPRCTVEPPSLSWCCPQLRLGWVCSRRAWPDPPQRPRLGRAKGPWGAGCGHPGSTCSPLGFQAMQPP